MPDAAAWPATAAALRAALQDEQAAYAYYSAALAAFGSYAPWPALHQACGQRIQSLAAAVNDHRQGDDDIRFADLDNMPFV